MLSVIRQVITAAGILMVAGSGPLWAVTNSLTIREIAGTSTTNYPIQIGRPFVAGEIVNYPQALVNGVAVPTQADIKQRWADGSVKHAILAFLIPSLGAGSTVTVTFQNQTSGNNTGLSGAQMQGGSFNFNAQMLLSNGTTTLTADARSMLAAGAFTAWTSGGIAQTVILADHSAARAFDIGFDSNRSFRPIFHATFWPGINKVRVRYIGEIANTESSQDQTYSLVLKTGNTSPAQVYSKAAFTHSAYSRWTKEFWIGGAPSAVQINHNLNYIRETRLVPYYDSSVTVPEAAIAAQYSAWLAAPQDINDSGNWTKAQGSGGAREEIGLYTGWQVRWLFGGDDRLRQQAAGNADLSAAFTIHNREGKAGKSMLGRPISIVDRPTLDINNPTAGADAINPVGTTTNGGWAADPAHQCDASSLLYLLTGDFWHLEEMEFWASWGAAYGGVNPYGRGPSGATGVIEHLQIREVAWALRTRIHAASLAPDGSLEKAYFTTLIADALASEEGMHNITTGAYNGNPTWTWGRSTLAPNWWTPTSGVPPVLHQYWVGSNGFSDCSQQSQYGINCTTVAAAGSQFEQHYMLMVLGQAKELGYAAGALLSWLGQFYTNAITDPGYNPYLLENGRLGTVQAGGLGQFTTFAQLKTGYTIDGQGINWPNKSSFDLGTSTYCAWATAGMSYLTGETNGQVAWNFMNANYYSLDTTNIASDPKWAILPRVSASLPPVSCDLNADGVVNVLDVQNSINRALGTVACGAGDLDGNGICDIVDVQRVINAALGQSCKTGP